MRDLTSRALDTATALGATYADVRVVRRLEESIQIKSTRVEGVSAGETEGFGIRVLVDGAWGFAASHNLTTAEADRVAGEAVRIAKASATSLPPSPSPSLPLPLSLPPPLSLPLSHHPQSLFFVHRSLFIDRDLRGPFALDRD